MKLLLITFSLITFSLNAQEAPLYEQVTDNVPQIGVKNEVYLGDRMVQQRTGEYRECLVPKISYEEKRWGGWVFITKANQPACKKDADSKDYIPNYMSALNKGVPNGGSYDTFRLVKGKKGGRDLCWMYGRAKEKCVKNISDKDVETKIVFMYQENTFQQSIEYAGRDGDNLRFNYSEFTDGFARQAFTREFQIDYAKGDVAAYKGAIIKIHDATNVNIVYEVIRNFQQ
jgi:hypothetical protein